MIVGEADGGLDPLPALGRNRFGFGFQLLGDETLEQRHVLQPATVVVLEQIAQDDTAGGFIGVDADELCPLVGGADRVLREHAPDLVWFVVVGLADVLPDLLLPGMIAGDGERHQLIERHAVVGIDIEQRWTTPTQVAAAASRH